MYSDKFTSIPGCTSCELGQGIAGGVFIDCDDIGRISVRPQNPYSVSVFENLIEFP